VDFGNLRVYQYDERGNLTAGLSMDKEVLRVGMGVVCTDKKALVVYQAKPNFVKGEELGRIKILVLELRQ